MAGEDHKGALHTRKVGWRGNTMKAYLPRLLIRRQHVCLHLAVMGLEPKSRQSSLESLSLKTKVITWWVFK